MMLHPAIFTYEITVLESVIEGNGHVNNVAYVQQKQKSRPCEGRLMICYQKPNVWSWSCSPARSVPAAGR
jgi:hypothetical protein